MKKYIIFVMVLLMFSPFVRVGEVHGESMKGTYEEGDKVVLVSTRIINPRLGDVVVFETTINGERINVIHRIISVSRETSRIFTKGDNNDFIDNVELYEDNIKYVVIGGNKNEK